MIGIVNFFGIDFEGFVGGIDGNDGLAVEVTGAFVELAAVIESEPATLATSGAESRFGDGVFFIINNRRSAIVKIPIGIGNFEILRTSFAGRHSRDMFIFPVL